MLEDGFGDGAVSFGAFVFLFWDDAGEVHFVKAYVQADCSSHKPVVVVAGDSAVGSVWFAFVDEEFIEASSVAFGV